MGSTIGWGLPYPELSDAPNGPAQIKSLAETLDGILTTLVPVRNAVKTTDKVVTNSATLSADAQLSLTVETNTTYRLSGLLVYAADSAADMRASFSGPTGATGYISGYAADPTGTNNYSPLDIGIIPFGNEWQAAGSGAANKRSCIPQGVVITAGTSGSVTLQIAQVTAHASNLTLYTGSWISLQKIA